MGPLTRLRQSVEAATSRAAGADALMSAAADAAAQQAPLPAGTPAEEVERLQVGGGMDWHHFHSQSRPFAWR